MFANAKIEILSNFERVDSTKIFPHTTSNEGETHFVGTYNREWESLIGNESSLEVAKLRLGDIVPLKKRNSAVAGYNLKK